MTAKRVVLLIRQRTFWHPSLQAVGRMKDIRECSAFGLPQSLKGMYREVRASFHCICQVGLLSHRNNPALPSAA